MFVKPASNFTAVHYDEFLSFKFNMLKQQTWQRYFSNQPLYLEERRRRGRWNILFFLNLPTLVSSRTISLKFDVTTSTIHVCDDGHLRELARPDLKRLVRFPAMYAITNVTEEKVNFGSSNLQRIYDFRHFQEKENTTRN